MRKYAINELKYIKTGRCKNQCEDQNNDGIRRCYGFVYVLKTSKCLLKSRQHGSVNTTTWIAKAGLGIVGLLSCFNAPALEMESVEEVRSVLDSPVKQSQSKSFAEKNRHLTEALTTESPSVSDLVTSNNDTIDIISSTSTKSVSPSTGGKSPTENEVIGGNTKTTEGISTTGEHTSSTKININNPIVTDDNSDTTVQEATTEVITSEVTKTSKVTKTEAITSKSTTPNVTTTDEKTSKKPDVTKASKSMTPNVTKTSKSMTPKTSKTDAETSMTPDVTKTSKSMTPKASETDAKNINDT